MLELTNENRDCYGSIGYWSLSLLAFRKNGTPFFVKRDVYDKLLDIMEEGIKKSKISNREKDEAQRKLIKTLG